MCVGRYMCDCMCAYMFGFHKYLNVYVYALSVYTFMQLCYITWRVYISVLRLVGEQR